MDGVGRMIVTAVGVNSFNGKQMMGLRVETEETPLQAKLADLADDIGYFGLVMAVITVVCLLVRCALSPVWSLRWLRREVVNYCVSIQKSISLLR